MPKVKRKTVKVVRKGRLVEIDIAVHRYNQLKKRERLAKKGRVDVKDN